MTFTKEQQKIALGGMIVLIVLINGYNFMTSEKQKTAPLMFEKGAIASSSVRQGLLSRGSGADPLNVFLERHDERYPGVTRDFFRMENPVIKPKPVKVSTTKGPTTPPPPPIPTKTPEEIAADASRADLSRFSFLGYLTDKESTLFLSKDGELFIVKRGDRVLKNYQVKEASKDFVILLDTATGVAMRIDMSGSVSQVQSQQPLQPQQPQQPLVQQSTQQQPDQNLVSEPQSRRRLPVGR